VTLCFVQVVLIASLRIALGTVFGSAPHPSQAVSFHTYAIMSLLPYIVHFELYSVLLLAWNAMYHYTCQTAGYGPATRLKRFIVTANVLLWSMPSLPSLNVDLYVPFRRV
jgi:hypothetical protein